MESINRAQAPFDPNQGRQSATNADNGALGKEDFLNLLVAQLSNQDPLSPTDPTEFVSQLSQFSSLEQLVNISGGLDVLAITQTAGTSAQMVSFIGKDVAFDDGTVQWTEGATPVPVGFELPADATEVEVTITTESGAEIETRSLGVTSAGPQTYVFDGKRADGSDLPADAYQIDIKAKGADGESIPVRQSQRGMVTGVTFEAGYPQLVLADGRRIGLSQVLQVLEHDGSALPSAPTPAGESPNLPQASDVPALELDLPDLDLDPGFGAPNPDFEF